MAPSDWTCIFFTIQTIRHELCVSDRPKSETALSRDTQALKKRSEITYFRCKKRVYLQMQHDIVWCVEVEVTLFSKENFGA